MFDYIKRFNAFLEKSMGTLDQSEIAVYVRLFHINNDYRRIEWFGVLNSSLAELAGVNEKTLIKARNSLKQKGYIDFVKGHKGRKTEYCLLPIENELENLQLIGSQSSANVAVNRQLIGSQSSANVAPLIKEKEKEKGKGISRARATQKFTPPTLAEVMAYVSEKNLSVDAWKFFAYYEAGNWHDAKGNPVKNWKQKILTWDRKEGGSSAPSKPKNKFTPENGFI